MAIGSSSQVNSNIPAGTFKTSEDGQDPAGPPSYPISSPSGVIDQPKPAVAASSSSSSGGGDIFGDVLKIGSMVLPFLAQGGPVTHGNVQMNEMADGGQVQPQGAGPEHALGMGYLIGALHQQKYGGTPHTLSDAAQEIKQIMASKQGQAEGFASGGSVDKSTTAATPATSSSSSSGLDSTKQFKSYDDLASYYGESNTGDSTSVGGDTSNTDSSTMPTSTPSSSSSVYPSYQDSGSTSSSSTKAADTDTAGIKPEITRGSYKAPSEAAQGGYMRYAEGGDAQQPLAQGQAFQGDGSVKGPGGPQDDVIPAKLSNGEFVMSAASTQFFGVDKLNKMNEQGKQGFMQMLQQVDQNQQQPPGGQGATPAAAMGGQPPQAPQAMPSQPPAPQMPQQAKQGGVMKTRNSGYMGM